MQALRRSDEKKVNQDLWLKLVKLHKPPASNHCFDCGTVGTKVSPLQRCGGCKIATYCSQRCAKRGWRNHKMLCRNVDPDTPIELELSQKYMDDATDFLKKWGGGPTYTILMNAAWDALNLAEQPENLKTTALIVEVRLRPNFRETQDVVNAVRYVNALTVPLAQLPKQRRDDLTKNPYYKGPRGVKPNILVLLTSLGAMVSILLPLPDEHVMLFVSDVNWKAALQLSLDYGRKNMLDIAQPSDDWPDNDEDVILVRKELSARANQFARTHLFTLMYAVWHASGFGQIDSPKQEDLKSLDIYLQCPIRETVDAILAPGQTERPGLAPLKLVWTDVRPGHIVPDTASVKTLLNKGPSYRIQRFAGLINTDPLTITVIIRVQRDNGKGPIGVAKVASALPAAFPRYPGPEWEAVLKTCVESEKPVYDILKEGGWEGEAELRGYERDFANLCSGARHLEGASRKAYSQ